MGLANSFANGGLSLSNDFGWPGPALPPNNNFANIFGVQNLTELTAIVPPEDKSGVMVEDLRSWWLYDAQSTSTPNGTTVVAPDSITPPAAGRWHIHSSQAASGVGDIYSSLTWGRQNNNAGNEWLRGADGVPSNLAPIILAHDIRLRGMSFSSRTNSTCTVELYPEAVARAGGVPLVGTALAVLTITAANKGYTAVLGTNLLANSGLGVYLRGTAINNPMAVVWTAKTV